MISFFNLIIMNKPSLTNFIDFVEKPKPVIPKTKHEIQSDINFYLNICVFLIIVMGSYALYYRFKYKEIRKEQALKSIKQFDTYLNEYYINDLLEENKLKQQNNIQY